MRKDVKTGMLAGTVLCLVAVVWFCAKHQIVTGPLTKFESQSLIEPANKELTESENTNPTVTAPAYEQVQPQEQGQKSDNAETSIIHTVVQGQTLSDISKIYYNTPYGWKKIYEANKEQLPQGPDTIKAGMRLVIPQ
jgi:nucleoid-associated protein YgaU